MSVIADLIRAGVDPDLVAKVAQEMVEAARGAVQVRTARQERNARYYAKASEKRLNASNSDVQDASQKGSDGSPDKEIPPTPPKEINPSLPPKTTSSLRSEDTRARRASLAAEFQTEFWPEYPNKVGKPVAESSWIKARDKASLDVIMAGLRAYLAKTDDRPWCNPSTWLNQERWDDRPAGPPPPRAGPPPRSNGTRGFVELVMAEIEAEERHGGSSDSDFDGGGEETAYAHVQRVPFVR